MPGDSVTFTTSTQPQGPDPWVELYCAPGHPFWDFQPQDEKPPSWFSLTMGPSTVGAGNTDCQRWDTFTITVSVSADSKLSQDPQDVSFGDNYERSCIDQQLTQCQTQSPTGAGGAAFFAGPVPTPVPSATPTPIPLIIADCDYKRKLSDHPQKVVGEITDLKVVAASNPTCSDTTVKAATWTFPGTPIGGYERAWNQAKVLPLPSQGPEMAKVYWTAPLSGTIHVAATLQDGTADTADQSIAVIGPTGVNVDVRATPAPEITRDDEDEEFLHLGTYTMADTPAAQLDSATGVHWQYSLIGPSDPDGDGGLSMVQLVNESDTEVRQNGTVAPPSSDSRGVAIPDESCIYYAGEQASVAANTLSTLWHSGDPPSSGLDRRQKSVTVNDSFTDYFIYKSNHHDSIWVSVASYRWKFQATAINQSKEHADFQLQPGYATNGTAVTIPDNTEPEWLWPADTVGILHPSADTSIDCAQ
jgi:hypothetical protein